MSENTSTPKRTNDLSIGSGAHSFASTPIYDEPARSSFGSSIDHNSVNSSSGSPIFARDSPKEQATPIQDILSDISMHEATPILERAASSKRESIRTIVPVVDKSSVAVVDKSSDSSIRWENESSGAGSAETGEEPEQGIPFEFLLKVAPRYNCLYMEKFAKFCVDEGVTHFKFDDKHLLGTPEKDKEAVKSKDDDTDKANEEEIIRNFKRDRKNKKASRGFVEGLSYFYNLINAFFSTCLFEGDIEMYEDEDVPGHDEGSSKREFKKHSVQEPGFRPVEYIQNGVHLDTGNPFTIEDYCEMQKQAEEFVKTEQHLSDHRQIQVHGFFNLLLKLMPLVKKECELDPEGCVRNEKMGPQLNRVTDEIDKCFRDSNSIFDDVCEEIRRTTENIEVYEELIKDMAARPLPIDAYFLFRKEFTQGFGAVKPAKILGYVMQDEKKYTTRPLSKETVNQVETVPIKQITDRGAESEIHDLPVGQRVMKEIEFKEFTGQTLPKKTYEFEVTGHFEYRFLKYRIQTGDEEVLLSLPDFEKGYVVPASHVDKEGNYAPPGKMTGKKRGASSATGGAAKRVKVDVSGKAPQEIVQQGVEECESKDIQETVEEYADRDDDSPAASPLSDDELEREVSELRSSISIDDSGDCV